MIYCETQFSVIYLVMIVHAQDVYSFVFCFYVLCNCRSCDPSPHMTTQHTWYIDVTVFVYCSGLICCVLRSSSVDGTQTHDNKNTRYIGKSYDCSCIVATCTCTVDHVDRRIYVPIHSLPVMWRFGSSDRSSSPFLRTK